VSSDDLVKRVKDLLHQGNVNRIVVRDEQGKLLLEVPAAAGVIGAVLAPWLAALGAIAALVTECTISVERRE
jgi:predicted regulator of Ras-like GTPase activity (Roadblock/LC7/MglB family)